MPGPSGVRALAAAHRADPGRIAATIEAAIAARESSPAAVWIHRVDAAALRARAGELSRGPREPALLGVPFAIKDNFDVAGLPTTAGCPDFSYVAQETATVVTRLLDAGAILVGKTNMDQFATGLVGTRSPYGACSSVADRDRVSGGSSSGSAVAVASGVVAFALGSDTAGSGRVPAAFNEIVGLKPTRGLVSTTGLLPACRTLDCVSIFARDAQDAGAVLAVAAARDAGDPYSRPAPTRSVSGRPAVLGVPAADDLEFFGDELSAAAWARARKTAARVAERVVEIDFTPFAEAGALLYGGPWVAERYVAVGAFLERADVVADPVVRGIVLAGATATAADAFAAQYRLAELRRRAETVFEEIDTLVVPTAPTFPTHAEVAAEPLAANARLGTYTNFVNLLDLAAVAVPGGRREDGLPFGVSLVGPAFADAALLRLARDWAQAAAARRGDEALPLTASAVSRP